MSNRLSHRQYIQSDGTLCPFCGSASIEGLAGVEVDARTARQEMGCGECGRFWHDLYQLVGYEPDSGSETAEEGGRAGDALENETAAAMLAACSERNGRS